MVVGLPSGVRFISSLGQIATYKRGGVQELMTHRSPARRTTVLSPTGMSIRTLSWPQTARIRSVFGLGIWLRAATDRISGPAWPGTLRSNGYRETTLLMSEGRVSWASVSPPSWSPHGRCREPLSFALQGKRWLG